MQTVPSLVGTGTAIAAAATGLVFGQSVDQNHEPDYDTPTTARRGARGHQRTTSVDRALPTKSASSSRISAPPSRRPATSSVGSHPIGHEPQTVADSADQISRPPLSRRQRPRDLLGSSSSTPSRRPPPVGDQGISAPNVVVVQGAKEPSTSSNSWFKRLSIRPLSQHGSPRSSILAESTSFPISHGSRAPLPSRSGSVSKPLPPNKLVKRSSPEKNKHLEEAISRKPKGRLPSLRRPATSHQRSAALQQFRADIDVAGSSPHPKYSFDEPIRPEELLGASPIEDPDQSARTRSATGKLGWASFFHSRSGEIETNPSSPGRAGSNGDAASRGKGSNSKRIHPEKGSSHSAGAHLVKPRMVSNPSTVGASLASSYIEEEDADGTAKRQRERMDSLPQSEMASEVARSAQPGRSFSSSFSHAANWASKKPGSLRRTKRGAAQGEGEGRSEGNSEGSSGGRRHVSAPVRGAHSAAGRVGSTTKPPVALILHGSALDSSVLAATSPRPAPRRNASSPLPPLSNLAGAHAHAHAHAHANANALADSSRRRLQVVVSPAPGGASFPMRPSQPSGSSSSSASAAVSQRRGGSSDGDARDFNSGDEDDTDLKSDTLFDSVRTAGSGRVRAVETPLESVYDESPPSTGGNKKSKRLSIQEILERTWDEDCSIMEEDETSATPVRVAQRPALDQQARRERKEDPRWFALEPSSSSPLNAHQLTHHVGRFSLDDDFDEDWTRDEHDAPFNAFSPPSKGNSLNASSANINPNVCLALASIGANSVTPPPPNPGPSHTERTLGNLFDWSEPPAHDKQNPTGGALRPQTAYGKQLGDSRGGRSVVRKGPMPMHVRSQSVPVVHEGTDDSKPMGSKYGTWGLGTKTVSEDWDEDFEFAGDSNGPDGKENQDPFAVPESIRASQPSVKAHSGQIRELSLLVNDLKRLCRHGGELNMLNGDQKAVWKEAEGIIALASPDEDRVVHDDDRSGSSVYMDAFEVNGSPAEEKHVDVPFEMLDAVMDAVMDCSAPAAMSKTAVVRERQSPRRRSVFSPDDDIFGANWPLTDERPRSNRPSRPRTPENQPTKTQDVNVVVRSVVETMQQNRSVMPVTQLSGTQETRKSYNATNRMQFDTNSLKALVKRAGELRDVLSDMIRKADQLTQSPIRTPRHERRLDSSPAFTRVFDDPGSSPPRRPAKTRGSSSTLVEQRPSPDNSPPSNMSRRVPLMTVI